jgi:2-polyprenyl-6-methoxyphenol hydroxylase-like FAD-dependent oxidoreductase
MANRTVLISGIGIAGPTLAYWLKAAGYEPTLVERAPALREGGYVIDFWGLGYDIAERMGLMEDINRIGYHVREVRIAGDRGQRVTGFETRVLDELTDGRFVTVPRSGLSRLLYEKVRNNTETLLDDEITGLHEHDDGVQVQFKRAGARRFDLVIGADGLHSNVRSLAFGPQGPFEKKLGYAVAALEAPGYRPRDEDVYLMYGWPRRMIGRFTQHDNRTLFLFIFATDGKPLPAALDRQKAMLRDVYRDGKWETPQILGELEHARELYFDSVSQIRMNRWSHGRVALVGDAAFCVSLLAGQGSALAMISAYVLAGELARANGQHEAAFKNYEGILRDYVLKKQKGAVRLAGAFAPKTRWGLWFRNRVIGAFAIPGLVRFVVGRDIIDTLQLPEYRWPSLDTPSR